jgi:poly(3-hydroxybutyrate) depolymerase
MNPASELNRTIEMGDVRRSYEAHVPADGAGRARPLLLDSNGRRNDGREYDRASGSDDVAFARATIADVSSQVAIDPTRVFAAGYANGAIFANRLGAELDGFAGIAAVCGYLAVGVKRPTIPRAFA